MSHGAGSFLLCYDASVQKSAHTIPSGAVLKKRLYKTAFIRLRGDEFATEKSVPVMRGDKAEDVHYIKTASSAALSKECVLQACLER